MPTSCTDVIDVHLYFDFILNDSQQEEDMIVEGPEITRDFREGRYDSARDKIKHVNVWVNKETVPALTMDIEVLGECPNDASFPLEADMDLEFLSLRIDGQKVAPFPRHYALKSYYHLYPEGKDKTSLKVEMDYYGGFKKTSYIEVNWLSNEEFRVFKENYNKDNSQDR
ncbi:hypothetical protein HQ544_02085 [Candidatus Falkowbacteria bacterium]|nr:hypothetical protein [Candidatus Falkowbacteria bacterium]